MTVALPLPEGYYSGALRKGRESGYGAELLFYAAAFGVCFLIWLLIKISKRRPSPLSFRPPEDMNPADVNYFYHGELCAEGAAALILYWVQKHYLAIREVREKRRFGRSKKHLYLETLRPPGAELKDYEKRFLEDLAASEKASGPLDTEHIPAVYFRRLKAGVYSHWNNGAHRVVKKGLMTFVGGVMTLVYFAVLIVVFYRSLSVLLKPFSLDWVAALLSIPLGMAMETGVSSAAKKLAARFPGGGDDHESTAGTIVLLLLGGGLLVGLNLIPGAEGHLPYAGIGLLTAFLTAVLGEDRRILSAYGKARLSELDGFRRFLTAGEAIEADLFQNAAFQEAEPAAVFSSNMPFALALGLGKDWAKTFEELMQKRFGEAAAPLLSELRPRDYWKEREETFGVLEEKAYYALPEPSGRSSGRSGGSGGSSSGGSAGGGSGGGGGSSW